MLDYKVELKQEKDGKYMTVAEFLSVNCAKDYAYDLSLKFYEVIIIHKGETIYLYNKTDVDKSIRNA